MLTLLGTSGTTIAVEPSVTGSTLLALANPVRTRTYAM